MTRRRTETSGGESGASGSGSSSETNRELDEPAAPEIFERPDVKESIEEALRKAREGDTESGSTGDELWMEAVRDQLARIKAHPKGLTTRKDIDWLVRIASAATLGNWTEQAGRRWVFMFADLADELHNALHDLPSERVARFYASGEG